MRRVSVLSQPGEPIWDQLSPDVQQSLMGAFARIDGLAKRLDVAIINPPAPGSVAAVERANKSQAYAHNIAGTALRSGLDHLQAWRSLLRAGIVPTYAHMSLLRAAYESALLAYWLLEPGIDPLTRQARGIAAQKEDYEERKNFEKAFRMTAPPPNGKLAEDRLADLMKAATQLGLTKLDTKGKRVLKTTVRGMVELFDLYEPEKPPRKGQWRYRLYSGYAHAKSWALALGAEQMAPFDASGQTIALVQAVDTVTVDATERCVAAVERAIDAYEELQA
jgi:hypothetical protein